MKKGEYGGGNAYLAMYPVVPELVLIRAPFWLFVITEFSNTTFVTLLLLLLHDCQQRIEPSLRIRLIRYAPSDTSNDKTVAAITLKPCHSHVVAASYSNAVVLVVNDIVLEDCVVASAKIKSVGVVCSWESI